MRHEHRFVPEARTQVVRQDLGVPEMDQSFGVAALTQMGPTEVMMGKHILLGHRMLAAFAWDKRVGPEQFQSLLGSIHLVQGTSPFQNDVVTCQAGLALAADKRGPFGRCSSQLGHHMAHFVNQLLVARCQRKGLLQ